MSRANRTRTTVAGMLARLSIVAAIGPLYLTACSEAPPSIQTPAAERAEFTSAGEVMKPVDWRSWIFVGTPLTPNALNDGSAPFPEFHNVYIEPGALAVYQQTGEFPDGTQLAKELVSVISQDADQDGSTMQVSGRGYFQGEFQGLELAVKDSVRFKDEPGYWAYFSFGHQAEPYAATAAAFPADACNSCHEASADQNWVFTQFYPVLRTATSVASR